MHMIMKTIPKIRFATVSAFAIIWGTGLVHSDEFDPPQFEASYSVSYGGTYAGKSLRNFYKGNENEFVSEHTLKPSMIVKLLSGEGEYTQVSNINVRDGRVSLVNFEISDKSSSTTVRATFDWRNRKIEISDGVSFSMPPGTVHDWESWYASLMLEPVEDLVGQKLTLVEKDDLKFKLKTFVYEAVQSEILDPDSNPVAVWRIELKDVKRSNRGITVWLARGYDNIPVRIEIHKKKNSVVFAIDSVNWLS